ncbi:MAG: GspE/PulE/PilB domain-containing protein, partial [Planctomycetota bacterium]
MTDDAQPGPFTPPRFNGEDLARLSTSGDGGAEAAPMRQRCAVLGIDWIEEEEPAVSAEAVNLIDPEVAVRLRVVPLRLDRDRLLVAMLDPLDIVAVDEVSTLTGHPVTRMGMEPRAFGDLMRTHYGTTAARMAESLAGEAGESAETD